MNANPVNAGPEEIRTAFEKTHRQLRQLVKALGENDAAGGAESAERIKTQVKRARRQLRDNRALLGKNADAGDDLGA